MTRSFRALVSRGTGVWPVHERLGQPTQAGRLCYGHHRRGGVYIVILMSVLIVTTIGLSGVALVQAKERQARTAAAAAEARLLARSAVEAAMQFIAADPDWRSHIGDHTEFSGLAFGHGTFGVTFIDPVDGDLTDDDRDPVVIRGQGRVSGGGQNVAAKQMVEVTMNADPQPLAILSSAVHVAGLAEVPSGKVLQLSGGTISSNNAIKDDGAIGGDLLAPVISGYGFASGSKTTLNTAMPMPSSIVSMYAAKAIEVPAQSNMQKWVLAPGYNPWGTPHTDGLYVVRPSGSMTIRRARLSGTLVVVNPGNTTTISNSVLLENARTDYPVLIVDGDLVIACNTSDSLVESDAGNLNPSGAPYNNSTDTDTSDGYPCEIHGLIYVTGKVQVTGNAKVVGTIICASTSTSSYALQIAASATVVYDPAVVETPPIGFTSSSPMQYVPSSWTQVVDH